MSHDDFVAGDVRDCRHKLRRNLEGVACILMIVCARANVAAPVYVVEVNLATSVPETLEQLVAPYLCVRLAHVRAMEEYELLHALDAIRGVCRQIVVRIDGDRVMQYINTHLIASSRPTVLTSPLVCKVLARVKLEVRIVWCRVENRLTIQKPIVYSYWANNF